MAPPRLRFVRRLLVCVSGAVALGLAPAGAQVTAVSARGFDLPEAIDFALANHPALRSAATGTRAAEAGLDAAGGVGDFTATGTGSLQYGGPVASIEMTDPNTGEPTTMELGSPVTGSLGIQLAKPLNLGSQRRAAEDAAGAQVEMSRAGERQTEQSIVLGVKQAFYNVLRAEHMRLIMLDAVDRTEAHLRIAQVKFNQGTVAQFDVDRAEADVASARAQLTQAEGGVRTALAYLSSAMGLDPADRVQVKSDLLPAFVTLDELRAREVALERPEIEILRQKARLNRALARQSDLEDHPVLSAYGSTSYSLGSAFSEGVNWALGVQLSWPFLNGDSDADAERQYRELASQAELDLETQTLQINTSLRVALEALGTAHAATEDAAQAVIKARDALSRVRIAYENDLGSWIDLRDAEAGLTASEQTFVSTLFAYRLALADVEHAVGVRELGDLAVPQEAPTIPDMAGVRMPSEDNPIPTLPGVPGLDVAPMESHEEGGR